MTQLAPGELAPDFSLPASTGGNVSLSELRGRKVILYFYPKDDTPGCTKEACGFRDSYRGIEAEGAVVLGVSRDDLKSHDKFVAKHDLPFPLLSDPDAFVAKAYGAYGTKNLYGRLSEGVFRHTFLIDEEGHIVKAWRRVKTDVHAEEILTHLQEAKAAP